MSITSKHILAGIALLVVTLLLYLKTNELSPKEHEEFEFSARSVRRLDGALNQDILKARFAMIGDYDRFPELIATLKQTVSRLDTIPSFVSQKQRPAITAAVADVKQHLTGKEDLLEQFKSQNAIFNNSLQYMPVLGSELLEENSGKEHNHELESLLNRLMRQVLTYTLLGSDDERANIPESLNALNQWRQNHPGDSDNAALAGFTAHVKSILEHKPEVETITSKLVSSPIQKDIDRLLQLYEAEFASALRSADMYRLALTLGCSLLVIGIGYTIFALHSANAALEERVVQRTTDLLRINDELRMENAERQRAESLQKALAAELADERQRLRDILDNVPAVIFEDRLPNAENRSGFASSYVEKMYGFTLDEWLSSKDFWLSRVHPDDRGAVSADCDRLSDGIEPDQGYLCRWIRKDGQIVWGETYVVPFCDSTGKVLGTRGVTFDVTKRILAERARRESEERFTALCAAAPIGIFLADLTGCCLYTNLQWQQIAQRPALDHIGDGWQRSIHPDDVEALLRDWNETVTSGRELDRDFRVRRPNGEIRWAHVRTAVLRADSGDIIGHVGTVADHTERRQSAQELERINKELIDMSRRAGMAEVATSVLHNVGNVLTSVNVSCSILSDLVRKSRAHNVGKSAALLREHASNLPAFFAEHPSGQKLPDFLEKLSQKLAAEQSAQLEHIDRLSTNIDHIKEIVSVQQSYASAGGLYETLEIADLVDDAIRMIGAGLIRHQVTAVKEYEPVPPACVDKHKVLQILVNLLRNAKEAASADDANHKQMVIRIDSTDAHVQIHVRDNGVGIEPENLSRIFSHGFTTKKNGHGFGLHSSILAAQEMGGQLTAHSDGPGTGATFTLSLPLKPQTSN